MATATTTASPAPTDEPVTNVRLLLREMLELYEPVTTSGCGATPEKVMELASRLSKALALSDRHMSFRERSHLLAAMVSAESVHILNRHLPTAKARNAALQNLLHVFQCLEACVSNEEYEEEYTTRNRAGEANIALKDLNVDPYIVGHTTNLPFADCWATHARRIASFVPTSSIGRFRQSSKFALEASHQPNRGGLSRFSFHVQQYLRHSHDLNSHYMLAALFPLDGSPIVTEPDGFGLGKVGEAKAALSQLLMIKDMPGMSEDTYQSWWPNADEKIAKCEAIIRASEGDNAVPFRPSPHSNPLAHFFSKEPSDFSSESSGETKDVDNIDQLALLRTARCNMINEMQWGEKWSMMHCRGNLIVEAYKTGYKQRDPGLAFFTMKDVSVDRRNKRVTVEEDVKRKALRGGGGFFGSHVYGVHADPVNGLVWAVGDSGKRIKGFRAGKAAAHSLARCNHETNGIATTASTDDDSGDDDEDSSTHRRLQHTFWAGDLAGQVCSLYSRNTSTSADLMAASSKGLLARWDLTKMQPQQVERLGFHGEEDDEGNEEQEEGDEPNTSRSGMDRTFTCEVGWRDGTDFEHIEKTRGANPDAVHRLLLPRKGRVQWAKGMGDDDSGKLLCCITTVPIKEERKWMCEVNHGPQLCVYDMNEGGRLVSTMVGHVGYVTDTSSHQNILATSSMDGTVKIWDTRVSGGATMTLLNSRVAESKSFNAVCLAGQGSICFAGGNGQSVMCWDLRARSSVSSSSSSSSSEKSNRRHGGGGRLLYELSTGTQFVKDLIWHEGSSTLIAKCEGHTGRMGQCYTENWKKMDEGDDHGCTWWPSRFALRRPGHYSKNYCVADDACFFYTFAPGARAPGCIPPNFEPYFQDNDW